MFEVACSGSMARTASMKIRGKQRQQLEAIVGRPTEAAGLVRRARVILLSEEGLSGREVALRLGLSAEAVSRIRSRFRSEGVAGLQERPKAGRKACSNWSQKITAKCSASRSAVPTPAS